MQIFIALFRRIRLTAGERKNARRRGSVVVPDSISESASVLVYSGCKAPI